MKTYRTFSDEMEARLCAGLLSANGLQSNVIGAKEYTSIVTGGREGNYLLLLNESDFAAADSILTELANQTERD